MPIGLVEAGLILAKLPEVVAALEAGLRAAQAVSAQREAIQDEIAKLKAERAKQAVDAEAAHKRALKAIADEGEAARQAEAAQHQTLKERLAADLKKAQTLADTAVQAAKSRADKAEAAARQAEGALAALDAQKAAAEAQLAGFKAELAAMKSKYLTPA